MSYCFFCEWNICFILSNEKYMFHFIASSFQSYTGSTLDITLSIHILFETIPNCRFTMTHNYLLCKGVNGGLLRWAPPTAVLSDSDILGGTTVLDALLTSTELLAKLASVYNDTKICIWYTVYNDQEGHNMTLLVIPFSTTNLTPYKI